MSMFEQSNVWQRIKRAQTKEHFERAGAFVLPIKTGSNSRRWTAGSAATLTGSFSPALMFPVSLTHAYGSTRRSTPRDGGRYYTTA
jgi:hypothetical protein